ncbi:MAG: hypothetical protein R3F60_33680 [bacterium]
MRSRLPLFALLVVLAGCGSSRALLAVQSDQITLEKTEADVVAAAGPPELILAHDGAETFYYKAGDGAVSVTLVGGVVAAFRDADTWPEAAFAAAEDADKPVSTGKVRLGMAEADLRRLLGDPNGITAADGLETWHWLTSDEVDSAVDVREGAVAGFADRPIAELTQNLPSHDRDHSTTSGRLRVGMSQADVEALIGEPDGKSGEKGVVRHRYESDPLFGDEIHYTVGYRDGRVVELSQLNISFEEERAERAEEARQAAAAAERQKEIAGRMLTILSNPAVQQALLRSAGPAAVVRKTTTRKTEDRTLDINGTRYRNNQITGIACSLDAPCPAGMTCHLITDRSGTCVQP